MSVEKNAAALLLDRGIKVPVTAPLLFRLFGKRKVNFVITQPFLGTLYRISYLYLSMGINDEQLKALGNENIHTLFNNHGKTLTRIVAQSMLNSNWRGKIFGRLLARWLFWKITPLQLLTIANVMVSITGTSAFTNTIGLMRKMKTTSPSQANQGS